MKHAIGFSPYPQSNTEAVGGPHEVFGPACIWGSGPRKLRFEWKFDVKSSAHFVQGSDRIVMLLLRWIWAKIVYETEVSTRLQIFIKGNKLRCFEKSAFMMKISEIIIWLPSIYSASLSDRNPVDRFTVRSTLCVSNHSKSKKEALRWRELRSAQSPSVMKPFGNADFNKIWSLVDFRLV